MSPEYNDMINELLVKYLLGEATLQEQATVQAWIAESPENEQYFQQFRSIWVESQRLAAAPGVKDEEAAWLRMKARLHAAPEPAKVLGNKSAFNWMRIAALFILVAGAALWFIVTQQEVPIQNMALQTATQPKVDTLPDGSVVTLNKHSQIDYPSRFEGNTRTIALKGEAFFDVKPDKEKPFIITVNDVTVKVVGTSFNIRSEGSKTEVIVETGIVQVVRNNMITELRPKERVVVTPQDSVLQKEPVKDQLYNYYRTKEFVCDNTPLWKLVDVLNEAYGSNIVIERAALRNLPLNTTFHNEPLDNILMVISETFSIEVVKKEDRIVLQ